MIKLKRVIIIILVLSNMIVLSGCWNYREVEDLAIAVGCAIDKGTNGKKYHLTTEIVDLSSGAAKGETKSALIETDGDTVFEAFRNSKNLMSHKLYFSNMSILIISEEVAKDGIADVVDFFTRDHEVRFTMQALVSQEKTAKEILQLKTIDHPIVSFEMSLAIKSNDLTLSSTNYMQLYQIVNTLGSEGESLSLCAVKSVWNDKILVPQINGIALFQKDKLYGYLSPQDTQYFLFATDKVHGGILSASAEKDGEKNVALEIVRSKASIKPVYENGKLSFQISTNTVADYGELETSINIIGVDKREEFIKNTEVLLEDHIKSVVKKVQSNYGVDIFGFGNLLSKQNPKLWKELGPEWETVFKDVDVEVKSKINIVGSGVTIAPIKVGE